MIGNTFRDHLVLEYEIPKYDGGLSTLDLYVGLEEAARTKVDYLMRTFGSQDPVRPQPGEHRRIQNHNRVFELSRGAHFAWAGHDDIPGPEVLARCVAILDGDPEVVNCYSRVDTIDAEGNSQPAPCVSLRLSSARPSERFREMIRMDHRIDMAYGLIRADVLCRTPLEGQYADSDRVLQAELTLSGLPAAERWRCRRAMARWLVTNRSLLYDDALGG